MYQIFTLLLVLVSCTADDFYHFPFNVTRSTVSGIAAYRSALTLDWLAGEDSRQRQLVNAFETEPTVKPRMRVADCIAYARPASGKVARLMLELLRNLEGDDGTIITELTQALTRTKLLVETSMLESEPDLDSLVQTPGIMMGEPHTTFPRILAMTWLITTDPVTNKKTGWCTVKKLNQYLTLARPIDIAKQMRALDPIVARARFIMEEFIQNVTPLNMYPESTSTTSAKVKSRKFNRTRRVNTAASIGVFPAKPRAVPPPAIPFLVPPEQEYPPEDIPRMSLVNGAPGLHSSPYGLVARWLWFLMGNCTYKMFNYVNV